VFKICGRLLVASLLVAQAPALEVEEVPADQTDTVDVAELLDDLEALNVPEYIEPVGPALSPGHQPLAEFSVSPRESRTIEPDLTDEEGASLRRDWVVNINTAPRELLERLPHLDPIRARSIVAHRGANGPFAHPQELTEVFGVTDVIYTQLAAHLACEGETAVTDLGSTQSPAEVESPGER
jgi:hypothetical protein